MAGRRHACRVPEEPTIHVMCGLVAAGKTTLARELSLELPAVRLSRDEWMLRLQGGRYDESAYVERLGTCTELMWDVALQVVAAGASVVLDWNFWSRERRADARHRAEAAGIHVVVEWLDVPAEDAVARARRRSGNKPTDSHEVDEEGVLHLSSIFEPPAPTNGSPSGVTPDRPLSQEASRVRGPR